MTCAWRMTNLSGDESHLNPISLLFPVIPCVKGSLKSYQQGGIKVYHLV